MNWKGFGSSRGLIELLTPGICLAGLTKSTKKLSIPAKIRSQNLLNTVLERYRYGSLLGWNEVVLKCILLFVWICEAFYNITISSKNVFYWLLNNKFDQNWVICREFIAWGLTIWWTCTNGSICIPLNASGNLNIKKYSPFIHENDRPDDECSVSGRDSSIWIWDPPSQ
jgi:hypothetical protein